MLVNIEDIKIGKRIRKEIGNIEPLKESLKQYGLLNPITINSKNVLIAGRRRLAAAEALGWTRINAVVADITDKALLLEIELEENTQRADFTDSELVMGYAKLQKLRNPNIFIKIWNSIIDFFKQLFGKKD